MASSIAKECATELSLQPASPVARTGAPILTKPFVGKELMQRLRRIAKPA